MPEKRKNLPLAIAIYLISLVEYVYSFVSYNVFGGEINWVIRDAAYTAILVIALIVDIVRKRQGGLGLSVIYIIGIVKSVLAIISTIEFSNGMDDASNLLLIRLIEIAITALPIIFIMIFFAKPNRACQILATIFIAILLMLGIYSIASTVIVVINASENYTYTARELVGMFLPRVIFFIANILAIAQLFVSVKFTKKVMPQPVPQYAPVQPVYQYPPQQYAQPTQPMYQPPVQQYPQQSQPVYQYPPQQYPQQQYPQQTPPENQNQ